MKGFATAHRLSLPRASWFGVVSLIALVGSIITSAGVCAAQPATGAVKPGQRYRVQTSRDIVYHKVKNDPERYRHRLDVYRPREQKSCPVLLFLHGGGWVIGSKDDYFGLYGYGTIARCLAERGLVVVLPNYRLSPGVRHPEHIKDVARAFAWTYHNIQHYGGDPKRIFIGGHSAGGHLAALLATDDRYLRGVGRSRKDIRGVIGVSGVYRVDDLDLKLSLTGPGGSNVMRADMRPFAVVFGDDPKVARQASPLTHVCPGLPPFLLVNAGFDYPRLREMTREFAAALKKNGCAVRSETIPWRTHETVVFDILQRSAERATVDLIVKFIHGPSSRQRP